VDFVDLLCARRTPPSLTPSPLFSSPPPPKLPFLGPHSIPHGFYEQQIREYLTQFGDVKHVVLSRSRKTAKSRG
jgi:nucleolar protein 15